MLQRSRGDAEGTPGVLRVVRSATGEAATFVTLELPWRENRRGVSCIPCGVYDALYEDTRKVIGGVCRWYHLRDVPDRGGILIHPGNFAGDVREGFASDVRGCILIGRDRGVLTPRGHARAQRCVLHSRDACAALVRFTGGMPMRIEVVNGDR